MEFVKITEENLEKEHICCAISNNKDCQVAAKKAWIAQQLKDGLVFLKGNTHSIPFKSILIDSKESAQNMPVAATTYALFYSGKFVTNEILSEKKFLKMCEVEE